MTELEKLKKQYDRLSEEYYQLKESEDSLIPVQCFPGKDNVIIGEVIEDKGEAKQGMVVLFSKPPEQPQLVYIQNYQIRTSQKTGKQYIKCFYWLTEGQKTELEKQKEQKLQEREEIYKKIKELEKWQHLQEFIKEMKQRGFTEEQVKSVIQLAEAGEYEAIARILKKVTNAYAVLYRYNSYVVLSDQPFYISKEWSDHWSLKDIVFPMHFLPTDILSDTHEIFTEDQIFEGFECEEIARAIHQKHKVPVFYTVPDSCYPGELTVVLPRDSELLKKLKLTKEANLSNELKVLVYAEVLGLNLDEMAELSKYV